MKGYTTCFGASFILPNYPSLTLMHFLLYFCYYAKMAHLSFCVAMTILRFCMLEYELLGKLTPMGILSIVLGCLLSYVVQSTKEGIR